MTLIQIDFSAIYEQNSKLRLSSRMFDKILNKIVSLRKEPKNDLVKKDFKNYFSSSFISF